MVFHCDEAVADRLTDELPRLASVLGGFFHQDAYIVTSEDGQERVGTEKEIFNLICDLHEPHERQQFAQDVALLVGEDDNAVVSFWNRHCDCHRYNLDDAAEARSFLLSFRDHLVNAA